jgi:hypothetical protein
MAKKSTEEKKPREQSGGPCFVIPQPGLQKKFCHLLIPRRCARKITASLPQALVWPHPL